MTSEEISKLPDPKFKPARDMMLCQRLDQTASDGPRIYLPDSATDKAQVCRVLATGDGIRLDDGFIRTAPYQRGARILVTPTDGYPIKLDGETYWIFEANEVMGELTDEKTSASGGRDTL